MTTPDSREEAAYELGWAGRPGYLGTLVAEVEAKARDVDLDALAWGPWRPCPDYGPTSWMCSATLEIPGDTILGYAVTSEDHDITSCWHWASNEREPMPALLDALRQAAVEHSCSAPRRRHTSSPGMVPGAAVGADTKEGRRRPPPLHWGGEPTGRSDDRGVVCRPPGGSRWSP